MDNSWTFKRFTIGCLIGMLLYNFGLLFQEHARNEQRRLWTPSQFEISNDALVGKQEHVVRFVPKSKGEHLLSLCISPISLQEYEKNLDVSRPEIKIRILLDLQQVGIESDSNNWVWGKTRSDRSESSCKSMKWISQTIDREYAIGLRLDREKMNIPLSHKKMSLAIEPNVRNTIGHINMHHSMGVFLQLCGIIAFTNLIFRGLRKARE